MKHKAKKKTSPPSTIGNNDSHSITFWIITGITVLFLFWAPFQRGLFNGYNVDFDRAIYSSFVWAAILLVIISIYLFFNYKYRNLQDFFVISIWLVPLSFLISLVGAASHYFAVNMLYLHIMYAVFFILGIYLSNNRLGNLIMQYTLLISGYLIVLFGMLNWLGNLKFANGIAGLFTNLNGLPAYKHAVMSDSNGLRLTSVFQYANTYSAYLIAILFGCVFFIFKSRKWYSAFLHALMLVPILVSFMLTLSRGGLVILPIVLLVLLLFFSVQRQIMMLIYMGLSSVAALLILEKITEIGSALQKQPDLSSSLQAWGIMVAASVIVSGLVSVLHCRLGPVLENKLLGRIKFRYASIVLPIGAVVLGTLAIVILFTDTGATKLLPENIRVRIENINFQQHSVLERATFYTDSLKLVKDYPVFGAGGGGWAALYEKYQNNPYTSRQAHNFFLQYLVEVGIVGFLIFILLVGWILYKYSRNYFKSDQQDKDSKVFFLILLLSLLIHSIIDFNLSYAFLAIVIFICLGVLVSNFDKIKAPFIDRLNKMDRLVPRVVSGGTFVLGLTFFILAVKLLSGNSYYHQAIAQAQEGKPYTEVIATVDKALSMQPNHPDYVDLKQDILMQVYQQLNDPSLEEQAVDLIKEFRKSEPYHRLGLQFQLNYFVKQRNFSDAHSVNIEGLEIFPWDIDLYQSQIHILYELGNQAREAKNKAATDQYWNEAIEWYNIVLARTKQLESLPEEQLQGREFNVTPTIALYIGQIYYMKGDYSNAASALKYGVTDKLDDPLVQTIARWYLAALNKEGANDADLRERLLNMNPQEAQKVEELLKMNFD
ncbi:O-antigen ligase family protein [Paenibacillus sp. J2TS4]|uniref:O-antigen ligase family protein n=1 Tax=Paenibacillus sp. J2TS4 TaxID=2807194 RepID=UPI001B240DA1|nr:O-antigen ligase family protein [Paenibacillus sp. J2TS4]GIP35122.1 O-antigen polymerase [Paenibacillus sp. J2TS4]